MIACATCAWRPDARHPLYGCGPGFECEKCLGTLVETTPEIDPELLEERPGDLFTIKENR